MPEKVEHFAPAVARKYRAWLVPSLLLVLPLFMAQPAAAGSFEDGLALFRDNEMSLAREKFEAAALEIPDDPEILAYLAHTILRLRDLELAVEIARQALDIDPCCNHAHEVLARAYNPMFSPWPDALMDSTWRHVNLALDCDSTDGNFWLSAWTLAIESGQTDIERHALRMLDRSEFFTPTLLAYTRWVLRGVPNNAILVTNGDMDTYPALALQVGEGFRADIDIVNMSLLQTPWYVEHVCLEYGLPLPWDDLTKQSLSPRRNAVGEVVYGNYRVLHSWLDQQEEGLITRPMAIALTVPLKSQEERRHLRKKDLDRRVFAGSHWYLLSDLLQGGFDETAMKAALAAADAADFKGPWTSERDRSPVRIAGTPQLRLNVIQAALRYAEVLRDLERTEEALAALDWAREFDEETGGAMDPELYESIRRSILEGVVDPDSLPVQPESR